MMSRRGQPVVFKPCHRSHKSLEYAHAIEVCPDCRRLSFRATMKARGITVSIPTYKGKWPYERYEAGATLGAWRAAVKAWS